MAHLLFVRHGQGTLDGGDYDRLSETGRAQARRLGQAWVDRGVRVDAAFAGALTRHRQTAERIAEAYEKAGLAFPFVETDARFNEIDAFHIVHDVLGLLMDEDKTFADFALKTGRALEKDAPDKIALFDRLMRSVMNAWLSRRFDDSLAISWDGYCETVLDSVNLLGRFGPDQRVVVFTSGNPIGIFIKTAFGLTDAKTLEIIDTLYNTSVTEFTLAKEGLAIRHMNDVSHLSKEMITQK